MIDVPVSWFAYGGIAPRWKWDQLWVARMLNGFEGRPPGAYRFVETDWNPHDGMGRVLVMPMGDYRNAGITHLVPAWLLRDLNKLPWCLMIATSDECSTFPWPEVEPWPEHCRLWAMTPRTDQKYPPGTRFIGEGSPTPAHPTQPERDLDLYFSGQVSSPRRRKAFQAMEVAVDRDAVENWQLTYTQGFLHSEAGQLVAGPGEDREYMAHLDRAWVAPAPTGTCTQDSFRLFEALEAGCIPVADGLSPKGNAGYWEMIGMPNIPIIFDWSQLEHVVTDLLAERHKHAAHISSGWQRYKRDVVTNLHHDVRELRGDHWGPYQPEDLITALVFTSPVRSNPDLSMIQTTIDSIRERLPDAEILILADGIRPEQDGMADDYHRYLRRLTLWANTEPNMCVFTHKAHLHQSGMMRRNIAQVHTPYLLFVEHDCPLEGDIPFLDVVHTMVRRNLNMMRFAYTHRVLPVHEYLFLNSHLDDPAPWRETIQYSGRPHLARTNWYRDLIGVYFGEKSRTYLEDQLYGTFLAGPEGTTGAGEPFANGLRASEAWKWVRMGMYTPEGDICRTGHLDGRKTDVKHSVVFAYDGERPEGAPPPGEYHP